MEEGRPDEQQRIGQGMRELGSCSDVGGCGKIVSSRREVITSEQYAKLKQANPYQAVPPPSLSLGPEGFTGPKFSGLGVTRLPQAGGSFLNLSIRSFSMS